jgi:DNA-damage-inducible protein J
MDKELKKRAESLFSDLGMNMSTAINVFVRQAVREGGIPFEITKDPFFSEVNMKHLNRVIKDMEAGIGISEHELIEIDEKNMERRGLGPLRLLAGTGQENS